MSESQQQQKLVAAALRRLEILERRESFDPANPESKPTPKQQQVLDDFGKFSQQWIRAGNQSGKSQTCARILTWVLTDTHPNWKQPARWHGEPLLAIVCGRTGKQIEDSLLPKIRSYLEPGTYKEVRIGNIVQRIEMDNGNRIVFQSLENPAVARERLMSYVAHITWCDELPPTLHLVRELLVRTQARDGYSLWSFTPTVVATEIQRFVDALTEPEARIYRFHMLDNPLYSDPVRKEQLLGRYSHMPQEMQDAIFKGDWIVGDGQVYYFNYDTMVEMPQGYSPFWRHVESVDPAISSALGLTVWAENPQTHIWYCIKAKYLRGIYVPTDLVAAVQRELVGLNMVRHISDPHESWYIGTASADPFRISYMGPYKKNERKDELIKGLQSALGSRARIAPVPETEDLINELQSCRWSDQAEGKIVNASKYHLLDSAQYFIDLIPKPEAQQVKYDDWQHYLHAANEKRKLDTEKAKIKVQKMAIKRGRRR